MPRRKPTRLTSPSGNAISRRADGRFQTWERPPGQVKRRYFYGATADECFRKALAYLTDSKAGKVLAGDGRTTVGDLLAYWISEVVPTTGSSNQTRTSYDYLITRHLDPTPLAAVRLDRLGVPDVQSWLAGRLAAGVPVATATRAKHLLSGVLRWAMGAELVHRNVAALVKAPKDTRAKPDPLSRDEVRKVLTVTRAHKRAALYEVVLTYGIRRGELLGLKWPDVDFERGEIRLSQQWKRDGTEMVQGTLKTDASRRTLPLLPDVAAVLEAHRAVQEAERHLDPLWQDRGYVFTAAHGKPLAPEFISHEFPRLARRAGIDRHVSLHLGSRHTAAHLMLAAGVPIEQVMALLGHSSVKITVDLYGHVRSGDKASAVQAMRDVLGSGVSDTGSG